MKIVSMNVSSFWKGEAGVKGLVEDQGAAYEVSLYLKGDKVRDYSCTCEKGNSYKGMCVHGEALFASYKASRPQSGGLPVHTTSSVHAMIREYTNKEVAKILAREEADRVRLVPVLIVTGEKVGLRCKIGTGKLYELQDLSEFKAAVEQGRMVEYGKELAFYHCEQSFHSTSRPLLSLLMGMAEEQTKKNEILLSRRNLDRLLNRLGQDGLEIVLPGGVRRRAAVKQESPLLVLRVEKYAGDGIRVNLEGIEGMDLAPAPVDASLIGEQRLSIVTGGTLYCCSQVCSEAIGPFLEQTVKNHEKSFLIGAKDMPLFYERVLQKIRPFARLITEIDLEKYKPEPLRAEFQFEAGEDGEVLMEPCLSYGGHVFHPLEDEKLPRNICRDIPGEFRVSQLIRKYFKYKDSDQRRLVIRDNEEELYRLLSEGMEEFAAMGEVLVSEAFRKMELLPPPRMDVSVSALKGWLEIKVDPGVLRGEELEQILSAYSRKKKYCRLKNGQFFKLNQGSIATLSRFLSELGVGKKELVSGSLRLPSYRALYLDEMLRDKEDVAYYRDHLFKAVVKGIRTAEDNSFPVPENLEPVMREYQKTGYVWLKTLDSYGFGGILADDMGLGKTLQVIALLEDAYSRKETAPSLIVCPASLVYNWEYELKRFAPQRKVLAVTGKGAEREALLTALKKGVENQEILITSYDLLKRDIKQYESISFRFQIVDEAQSIKNARTQSARAVKAITAASRFALTGTPVENHLGELWSIFDYLMPGFLFGKSYFKREFETPIAKDGDREALKRLKKLIGPFLLRRMKKDVLKELPPKLEKVVYAGFGEEQEKLYGANALVLKERLKKEGSWGQEGERLLILSELMRLRQICCDPRLCYENYRQGSAKLEVCMDLIQEAVAGDHKLLLFSQFTSMLELIEKELKKEGIACQKLTGADSKEARAAMVQEFQKGEIPVFLISLKAGGTGLNLTAADMVIHYDPWWNIAAQNQATDRTHRIGQEKQVMVYQLIVRNTIEESIIKLQAAKRELVSQVMAEAGVSLSGLSREDLLKLLSYPFAQEEDTR